MTGLTCSTTKKKVDRRNYDYRRYCQETDEPKVLALHGCFLGSVATSVAGIVTDNQTVAAIGTVCGVASAAIYAAAEQAVDAARLKAGGDHDGD